jgi:hypothetical protein
MSKQRIAEILVSEWKLSHGWTPARILQEHFAGEQRFCKVASERMAAAEAKILVAGITLDFVKEVASAMKTSMGSIIEIFKNSDVVKFFSKIGWSFKKLHDLLKKGYQTYKEIRDIIKDFALEIGIRTDRWSKEALAKLDEFVKTNSKLMRISGIALGGLLIFVWFHQAFTGDSAYDFDVNDILNGLSGRFSFADIFGGHNGLMLLVSLAMGVSGVSFPWPGSTSSHFIASVIAAMITRLRLRFRKERQLDDEKIPALAV